MVLGSEVLLPMSFSWPVFPGLDQDLFPPMVFLVFWDSIPKRCKGAAPLRRAGARVAGRLHHHQAGARGLAPRGRAAARLGLVAFGVCRFARAR